MNAEQRQMAADFWTKPTDLSHKATIAIYYDVLHHGVKDVLPGCAVFFVH